MCVCVCVCVCVVNEDTVCTCDNFTGGRLMLLIVSDKCTTIKFQT